MCFNYDIPPGMLDWDYTSSKTKNRSREKFFSNMGFSKLILVSQANLPNLRTGIRNTSMK